MPLTKEQRELERWRRRAKKKPSADLRSLLAGLELADMAARSIMERRPGMSRERAEIVRDRWCALRIAKRSVRHANASSPWPRVSGASGERNTTSLSERGEGRASPQNSPALIDRTEDPDATP